jgi:hypothetical protein
LGGAVVVNANIILDHLEGLVGSHPDRTSGEDLYAFVRGCSKPLIERDRDAFLGAMRVWLSLRSEPRTMLAIDLAAEYFLWELRPEVEALLAEVEAGNAFLPHYAEPIGNALAVI